MKKMIFYLLAIFASSEVFAQELPPGEYLLQQSMIPNKAYETKIKESWVNDSWVQSSKSDLIFNHRGYLSEEVVYNSDNGVDFSITGKIEYTRNSKNKLVSITHSDYISGNYEMVHFISFEYNNFDNVSHKSVYEANGNVWKLTEDVEYYYSVKKKITNTYVSTFKDGLPKAKYNYVYSYNADDIINRKTTKVDENGSWKEIEYIDFTYDTDQKLIKANLFTLDGSNWVSTEMSSYIYQNDLLISYQNEEFSNGTRKILEHLEFKRDKNDHLIEITSQNQDKGVYEFSERISYKAKLPSSTDLLTSTQVLKAFPNPANELLIVSAENTTNTTSWNLMNSLGSIVKTGNISPNSNEQINTSDLAPGMYILNWNSNSNERISNKILITH